MTVFAANLRDETLPATYLRQPGYLNSPLVRKRDSSTKGEIPYINTNAE